MPSTISRVRASGSRLLSPARSVSLRNANTLTEVTERTDAQEKRSNGERTDKTKNDRILLDRLLLRSTSVDPFLLCIRVLRVLRALELPSMVSGLLTCALHARRAEQ